MFNNKSKLNQLQTQLTNQQSTITQLSTQLSNAQSSITNKDTELSQLRSTITELRSQLSKFSTEVLTELDNQIKTKQSELSSITQQLDNSTTELHLQSLSFFNLEYNSQYYKDELVENKLKQRNMLSNLSYFTIKDKWIVNNSAKDGSKLSSFLIDICFSAFNALSDSIMQRVSVSNFSTYSNKLKRVYKNYNDNLSKFNIELNSAYLELKLEELELNRNIAIKLADEKEERDRQREILREQAKLEKELLQEREKLERELVKLRISKLDGEEVDSKIEALEERLSDNDKILNNTRFGAVYIISNPSFGADVVKIGLTRRVFNECESRLSELNNASVPFLFNPHCILWSDDCFKLESDLHKEFDQYRVNKINPRKEYFKLPLSEIERVVHEKYDPNAIFNYNTIDENFKLSGYKLTDNFVLDNDANIVL